MDRDALETMARTLDATGEYRVMRRYARPAWYASPTPAGARRGLVVDVETTGLDHATDAIIELALLPFDFGADGTVYTVHEPASWFEDPGRAIPADTVALTGITDEMVRGQRIDEPTATRLMDEAVLVVAHNAGFDRRFVERRLPGFAAKHWACSQREVPWTRFGCRGAKLDYLLFSSCNQFHTGHRAADDCLATLHVLATPRDETGASPMRLLLDSARRRTHRVWAVGTAFELKDLLKARGYQWFGGSATRGKAWYRDCASDDELAAEKAWLTEHAYGGRSDPPWQFNVYTGRERYSDRME
jgi:DNA polymerase-3 subunit epsilon